MPRAFLNGFEIMKYLSWGVLLHYLYLPEILQSSRISHLCRLNPDYSFTRQPLQLHSSQINF